MICNLYKKYAEIIKYLIFGVLTTLVSISSYALFSKVCNINMDISNVLSWITAVTFAFITNKKYVFESNNNKISEALKFYASRVFSLLVEIVLLHIFVNAMHMDDLISKIIIQVVVIILNYVLSKLFVFVHKN